MPAASTLLSDHPSENVVAQRRLAPVVAFRVRGWPLRRPRMMTRGGTMRRAFNIGEHVSWNSEAGRVRGTIRKKITSPIQFKGYAVRASKREPRYLIRSDKTSHLAMHKGSALGKIRGPAPDRPTS